MTSVVANSTALTAPSRGGVVRASRMAPASAGLALGSQPAAPFAPAMAIAPVRLDEAYPRRAGIEDPAVRALLGVEEEGGIRGEAAGPAAPLTALDAAGPAGTLTQAYESALARGRYPLPGARLSIQA